MRLFRVKCVFRQKKGPLTIQCDEIWSFVDDKGNKQWIWFALDVETREIVGVHVGDRSEEGARQLWKSLSGVTLLQKSRQKSQAGMWLFCLSVGQQPLPNRYQPTAVTQLWV
jgi:hypothetical protein